MLPNRPSRSSRRAPTDDPAVKREAVRSERFELHHHLQAALEPAMVALGLVFLALLLLDYSGADLTAAQRSWLDRIFTAIWGVFLVDFGVRFVVAPAKGRFLRENWLGALSLVLPFLRPLRALRAVRAIRSLSLVRLLGGINRGMRVLRRVTRGRQFAYVGALTVFVTLAGAVGVLFFDRGVEGASIRTFGDALWWSATMVTTINNEKYAVSPEARVIAVLQRVYAVSVFGFVTASIASDLVGRAVQEGSAGVPPASDGHPVTRDADVEGQLAALRHEVALLRQELAATHRVSGTRAISPNRRDGRPAAYRLAVPVRAQTALAGQERRVKHPDAARRRRS
jgi:voltage-gated potassium channel